jgi:hypothetical protein
MIEFEFECEKFNSLYQAAFDRYVADLIPEARAKGDLNGERDDFERGCDHGYIGYEPDCCEIEYLRGYRAGIDRLIESLEQKIKKITQQ